MLMVTQNMVFGLSKVLQPNAVCKGFVLGKNHQVPFDSGNTWHALNHLDLVYNDILYLSKLSLVGAMFFTLIDNLSCYTWVDFIKNKSHVFERFKEFRKLTEKECI